VTPPLVAWFDGRIVSRDDLRLPSGLRQGDGVFETIRTYDGIPFRLADHLERLLAGARSLGLAALPSPDVLREAAESTLAACKADSKLREWIVRPCLFSDDERTGGIVLADPWARPRTLSDDTPVVAGLSSYRHPGAFLRPPGANAPVKWLARGPLAHALRDARMRSWDEALLRNEKGDIVEGTRSNLFVFESGRLLAPGPASGALPGITRGILLDLARDRRIEIEDRPVGPHELVGASETFLTSTLLGVAPISVFEGATVGSGTGGRPLTRELRGAFEELVRRETRALRRSDRD
jgi:branched-subunit amino acid aminotransferase/4-amino-4-deoxychorismate lyase